MDRIFGAVGSDLVCLRKMRLLCFVTPWERSGAPIFICDRGQTIKVD
jgi:thiamine biosynthesis protein ThiC